jgi:hypothetical protein
MRRNSASSFYHSEALGSVTELTGIGEATTDTYLYDAFGSLLASSGSSVNPFRYGGKVGYYRIADGSLLSAGFRELAPGLGRWLSRDPLRGWIVPFASGWHPQMLSYVLRSGARVRIICFPADICAGLDPKTIRTSLLNMQWEAGYRYCANMPTFCFDPSGLSWCLLLFIIVLGVAVVFPYCVLPFLSRPKPKRRKSKGKGSGKYVLHRGPHGEGIIESEDSMDLEEEEEYPHTIEPRYYPPPPTRCPIAGR